MGVGYEFHLEVWTVMLAVLALGIYVAKVVAPKLGKEGKITSRQKWAFFLGVGTIWIASGWPIHDISESYLYSVHMIQHLAITFVAPPLLMIAMPEWLAKLMVGWGSADKPNAGMPIWLRRLGHPVVAGLSFNAMVAISHIPLFVNTSVSSAVFHYFVHLAIFSTAMIMWLPVCGPFKELRLGPPGQMAYLFAMSLLPTIPAAFLTFANAPIYSSYVTDFRLWGISALSDQQAAGLIMKLVGGFYLWAIIAYIFFKWALANEEKASRKEKPQPASTHQPPLLAGGLDDRGRVQTRDHSLHRFGS